MTLAVAGRLGRKYLLGLCGWALVGSMALAVALGVLEASKLRAHWVGHLNELGGQDLPRTLQIHALPLSSVREEGGDAAGAVVWQRLTPREAAPGWLAPVGAWLIRDLPVQRELPGGEVIAWKWNAPQALALWWQGFLPMLYVLAAGVFWGLLGAMLLFYICAHRRIRKLSGFFEQIDYRRPARLLAPYNPNLRTQDELDAVAIAVNQVLIGLQGTLESRQEIERELRDSRRLLEKRVAARTEEITALNKKFLRQQFEAKMAALEAKQARWEAEKANQDKTRFLAAASHDLRQPLHAMNLLLEALHPHVQGERGRQIHENLGKSLDTMKQLFNSLLDISKLEAGVLKPEKQHFSLDRLFDRLEILFRAEADEKGLDLRVVRNRYWVYSDPRMLGQVIVNLVGNAIKYTPSGWVLVGCRYGRGHLKLVVWDSGVGIPDNQQAQVFKEFVQLHNPERDRSKGLGLGLAIVKRTCQLLGHSLKLTSREGWGTRFELTIPLGERQVEPETRALPQNLVKPGQRVLVLDDDPAILVGMKALLESWGLEPMLSKTLDEALGMCRQTGYPPKLIISDFRLAPNLNGIQAIKAIQQVIGQQVPALLITGDTDPARIRLAAESPYPMLHKPIRPAHLRAVCMGALQTPDVSYKAGESGAGAGQTG
ncbi:MAG: response regulator [Gammaproteobacteria bacterium]|nr:MAG: response regulator [Gammaproteobacteria bacterium]